MTGVGNLSELIVHLRTEAERWREAEYDAIRNHRDRDAEDFRKNALTCANLAAELSTPAMEEL